jgi:hypothetical protein
MRPLDNASHGQCVPWTMRPLDDASLGRCVPWTMRPLDDASLGQCVPWTMRQVRIGKVLDYRRCPERKVTLRFLGIILRVLRLEVSVWIS